RQQKTRRAAADHNCLLVVLNQRMSLKPSPLKSPVVAITQSVVAKPGEPLVGSTVVPFNSQITTCPLLVLYQSMSVLPSVSQSAAPPLLGGLPAEHGPRLRTKLVPFTAPATTCRLVVLYQRMSFLPSPLKSPVPTIPQGLGAEPGEPPPITDVPFSNQI